MVSCMTHYVVALFVVSTNIVIFPVSGQCTVEGCEVGDPSMSMVEEIQEIKSQQDVIIKSLQQVINQQETVLKTVISNFQAVDRGSYEQNICMKQIQGIYDFFNVSFLKLKNHQDIQFGDRRANYVHSFHELLNASLHEIKHTITTGLQAVERRSQEQDAYIKQVQSFNTSLKQIKDQQETVMTNIQTVDRRSQEQVQSMSKFLNSSFLQMKSQHDYLSIRLQVVDQRSQEHTQSIIRLNNSFFMLLKDQQSNVTTALQADHRISQEQVQRMFKFLNSSLQQMKTQQDTVTTNIQAVDRRLSSCDISIRNQTQILENLTKAVGTGDWIVIMHRFDRSLNFNRSWADYRNGFGDKARGEFWLGNEEVHRLTNRSMYLYTLRIEMQLKRNGSWYYAEYSAFSLDSENNKYTLRLSGYSGNAGDSLTNVTLGPDRYLDGIKFATWDNRNDATTKYICARGLGGGWWFNSCSSSCLTRTNFYWDLNSGWPTSGLLQAARMMIKSK